MGIYTTIEAEDLEQEAALARLEAQRTGFDPEVAAADAVGEWASRELAHAYRCRPQSIALHWLPEARKVVGLKPARARTPGQRRKAFRNQLILVGSLAGFSQRELATAFSLPHSRICAILSEMKAKAGLRGSQGG